MYHCCINYNGDDVRKTNDSTQLQTDMADKSWSWEWLACRQVAWLANPWGKLGNTTTKRESSHSFAWSSARGRSSCDETQVPQKLFTTGKTTFGLVYCAVWSGSLLTFPRCLLPPPSGRLLIALMTETDHTTAVFILATWEPEISLAYRLSNEV